MADLKPIKVKKIQEPKELIKYTEVENTPFTVISREEKEHFIMLGKYRISEPVQTKEEAIEEAKTITWNKIVQVMKVMLEKRHEL